MQDCGKEKRFKCNICGRNFRRNFQLKEHVLRMHKVIL